MELPIAQESYHPSPEALVRAAKRAQIILARTAAEETTLDTATLFTNPHRPALHALNFAAELHLIDNDRAQNLLDTIDAHFQAAQCRCLRLESSDLPFPPELAAAAQTRGYASHESILYLLQGYNPPHSPLTDLQIIPARAAYPKLQDLFQSNAPEEADTDDPAACRQHAQTRIDFLDDARLDLFLGRLNAQTAGFVSLLSLGQIGLIEHVFTLPALRRRGVATRLLDHAIELCERAQYEQVILTLPPRSPAAPLFHRLGFLEVTRYTSYVRP